MSKYDYDLVAIGAGSGGLVCAVVAAKLGLKTALIEAHKLGGDCLNYGCVPSKSLLHCAKAIKKIREAEKVGASIENLTIDYEKVKAYVAQAQQNIRDDHENTDHFANMGMDIFFAKAQFVDDHTLQVADRQITARIMVVATGSRARKVPIEGIDDAGYVTNEGVFTMPELPKRFGIIGGGPIGTEMAWAHNQLGSEVTILEYSGGILSKDDPEMSAVVQENMEADGVKIICNAQVKKAEKTDSGKLVSYEQDDKMKTVEVDEILLAVGRQPNVESLALDKAGVEFTERGIPVNLQQQTNVPHIYACGDVTGGFQFTHAASLEAGTVITHAIIRAMNFLPFTRPKTSYHAFPWCTYTDPELASVGLNEAMAKKEGIEYTVARTDFMENDRAIAEGRTEGKIKVLIGKKGKIVGAQIVGPNAGELIHEYAVAMKNGLKIGQINSAVHAYPTLAEINKRVIGLHLGEKLFRPSVRKWLGRLWGFAGIANPTKGEINPGLKEGAGAPM